MRPSDCSRCQKNGAQKRCKATSSSLPKGRSLASKFSSSLGFQPSSSYHHMSHPIHHRSCPFLAFPLVSFLPFSLLAPISSDHLPLQHVQSSSSFCPISFLLSFSFRSWS